MCQSLLKWKPTSVSNYVTLHVCEQRKERRDYRRSSIMVRAKVLIADSHPLVRSALREALDVADGDFEIIEAGSQDEIAQLIPQRKNLDLVLLGLTMPDSRGLSCFIFARRFFPKIPIVIVSAEECPSAIQLCKEIGASGFVPKSTSIANLRQALRDVLAGGTWFPNSNQQGKMVDGRLREIAIRLMTLTPQQMHTLMLISKGHLNKEISKSLGITEATVKAHIGSVLRKLKVHSRTHAVVALNRIASIAERDNSILKASPQRAAYPDVPIPFARVMEQYCLPNPEKIVAAYEKIA